MYIKEICLEGFKSYATRTVVPGFDPFFNAITGLNGSGKSNILDSICFVLGVTNLQQVRAANLQELVYKQGQAGITKATVSVVFDNSDRSRSPLGYEDSPDITVTRQIVVGGRNKYLINGHVAQPSRVQEFFNSVQLNVNNPHFLIMQGRITKVLNMKPPEILSMLEEAAGTRMYETKKESVLKELKKKKGKVDEIDMRLDQEILPALEKLQKERMQYMQWANGNTELGRLIRFCVSFEFVEAEKVRDSAFSDVLQTKVKITELDDSTESLRLEMQEMEKKIASLTEEKEARLGGELKDLSEKVATLSCSLVKENSMMTHKEESLETEKASLEKLVKNMEDLKKSITEKDSAVKEAEDGASDIKKRVGDISRNLEECEEEYEGVVAEDKRLEDQLRDAKAAVGNSETERKELKIKINHFKKLLSDKRKVLASKCSKAVDAKKELGIKRKDIKTLRKSLESLTFVEGQMEALQKECFCELKTVDKLNDRVETLSGQLANAEFTYGDPVKNFKISKVKIVAKLIKFLELMQTDSIQHAASILYGNCNADLALRLIGYDDEVKNAMAYVFGSTSVCESTDAAKEVAFNRDIRTPTVTLEGDIFQPSGLLTGGSRRDGGELLGKLHELAENESTLCVHQKSLSEVEEKIARLLPLQKKSMQLKSQLGIKLSEVSLFQAIEVLKEYNQLRELVRKLEHDVKEATTSQKKKNRGLENCRSTVSFLKKSIKDHRTHREARLKGLDKQMKTFKSELVSASNQLKGHENERERLIMEKDDVIQELAALESQLASSETQINALAEELDSQKSKVGSMKQEYDQAESELKQSCAKIKECDSQISSIVKGQHKLQQKLSDTNVERRKLKNEVKPMEAEYTNRSLNVDWLVEKHCWIAAEKHLFGNSGTDYDFSSRDINEARQELEDLHAEQTGLEKRVNKKVMAMFEKAKDEFNDLISKKNIIENDKSKITKVIEELDEKKKETLKVTWVKVTKDFGSIFSTLLPGTMAKLEPPEGGTFLDGLEVRVAFGSVWKQSLSELSGGQRSLLALSLILALLLFKPAPLYILDEVDAALDLSHTQNIGRMIKAHFPHSQFIVVSLKEGMLSNANVVFRTKFVDGVSTVTRVVSK